MSRPRIAIAGAGVIGLSVGLALLRRGAAVTLHDDFKGPSASEVAAGMLAPAFESALDPEGGGYSLLSHALSLWPALLEIVGAPELVVRAGGLYVAAAERLDGLQSTLEAADAPVRRLSGAEARALQPALADDVGQALYAPGEALLSPIPALSALQSALIERGGEIVREKLTAPAPDATIIAAGYQAHSLSQLAPELAQLRPVKGQILTFPGAGPETGPVIRGDGVYIAPQAGGVRVGATMEWDKSDNALDPIVLAQLQGRASALVPSLAPGRPAGRAGVRAATPDGLPLAGPSSAPGVFLATGLRRNGWLLAPLVAEVVAAAVLGEDGLPEAALFDPRRFS